MSKLVLIRHGQSEWNLSNQFTGWVDVNLSEKGVEEAKEAGRKLKEAGIEFDQAYTSVLTSCYQDFTLCFGRIWPIMDSRNEDMAFKRTSLRCITR